MIRRDTGLCRPQTTHSRGPRSPDLLGRNARSANVMGAPSTSSTGTSMASTMCCSMCRLTETML